MTKKVAIIGMAFRFPGTNTDQYWSDLLSGKDLVTSVDESRWAQETFRHPNKNHPGTSYTFAAGSIGDVSTFDANFFGISPREAAQMDPQQRLLLEMTWEAFENSGVRPSTVKGSRCGVFIGIASADYAYRFADDLGVVDSSVATGNTASIAANRISYAFDLRGPSMALDTACSSSLVAFHQACQSIGTGESEIAVAGGVSLHLHPYGFIAFSKASMLSKRGKCSVFDAAGDGYVRSEGGGIFILKDYDSAIADGNPILALVAASGVNSDGKKSGLTVPSSLAQSTLIKETYAKAGIEAGEVDYLEAHGTGTAVGDPIETHGLGEALGLHRLKDRPLLIGSVKSNMGHLEAASGVAGMVKALHCIIHRVVPPTIHLETPNPKIKFDEWNLRVATTTTELKKTGKIIVGVNSFGFGGANAHVILEGHPKAAIGQKHRQSIPSVGVSLPIVVSGRSLPALKAAANDFAHFLSGQKKSSLYDIAHTTVFNRDWHDHRAVVFGHSPQTIAKELLKFAQNVDVDNPVEHGIALSKSTTVAFIYSGNGSQWEGMGQRLLQENAIFKKAVQKVDQIFKHYADFSLEDELAGKNGAHRYELTEIAQPALFALQVGITEMLRSRGLIASAVTGHSVGEVAAAWASGALTLEDAVLVIYHRSRLQGKTKGQGFMTAVGVGDPAMRAMLQENELEGLITIAGVNSSRGVTIAGEEAALIKLETLLTQQRTSYKRLPLNYAFHSPSMDVIESSVHQTLAGLSPHEGHVRYVSTVTGETMSGSKLDADYWWRNIRQPVLFERAINNLQSSNIHLFVEIGPHPVLRSYINECLKDANLDTHMEGRVIPTVLRGNDSSHRVWSAASQVLIAGASPDWKVLFPYQGQLVRLPNYPWQRETHWHKVTAESLNLLHRQKNHPLLGYRLNQHDMTWENQLDPIQNPTLADHIVGEAVVFPGTGFVELALAAATQWQAATTTVIEELEIRAPLLLSNDQSKVTRVAIDVSDGGFTIKAKSIQSDEPWQLHVVGRVPINTNGSQYVLPATNKFSPPNRAPDFDRQLHQQLTSAVGLNYGPAFQAIECGWVEPNAVWAKLTIPPTVLVELAPYLLHPSLLDCTFQLIIHLLKDEIALLGAVAYLPTKIGRLVHHSGKGAPVMASAHLHHRSPHSLTADFLLFDATGELVVSVKGARFRSMRLAKDAADQLRLVSYRGVAKPLAERLDKSGRAGRQHEKFLQIISDSRSPSEAKSQPTSIRRAQQYFQAYTEQVEPLLDALCSAFAAEIVKRFLLLAQPSEIQNAFSKTNLLQYAGISTESAPLLSALLVMLVEDEYLTLSNDGLYKWNDDTRASAQDIWNTLLADYPDHFPLLNAVGRVGLNLDSLLTGKQLLSQILPVECTFSSLFRHVMGADARRMVAHTLQACVAQELSGLSEGKRFRIVEISEGLPQFVGYFAREVDNDRIDYVVATTDSANAEACRRLFEPNIGISVKQIGHGSSLVDPTHGGHHKDISDGVFQLAIMAADFSTEQNALLGLDYARKVLTSGGTLLFAGLPSSRWLNFVFGGSLGWWLSSASGEFVSLQQPASYWQQRIESLGIHSSKLFKFEPHSLNATSLSSSPYLLIARATDDHAVTMPLANLNASAEAGVNIVARNWVFVTDSNPSNEASKIFVNLSEQLSARGECVINVMVGKAGGNRLSVIHKLGGHVDKTYMLDYGDIANVEALLTAIKNDYGSIEGLVHLAGYGAASAEMDPNTALRSQVYRCAITASFVQAAEKTHMGMVCWLVTSGAALSLLPKTDNAARVRATSLADALDSTLWGFGRALMNEPGYLAARLVDFEPSIDSQTAADMLCREMLENDEEHEVVITKTGERFVSRMHTEPRRLTLLTAESASEAISPTRRLGFQFPGQLRNLRWQEEPRILPKRHEIEIEVHATGLNFRDVMYALGLLSDEAVENGFAGPTLGLECAGFVTSVGSDVKGFTVGDAVVAFGPSSFSNRVLTSATAAALIPNGISFEAAATIPSTFFTAYYALQHLAQLAEGERVLIHGAAGGVGIAAIQIAKLLGAEIYATAGSDEKRDFLKLLGVEHIYDSRSLAFADEILAETGGVGVDVVLNSLAGEAINRNFNVLKPFGRFLELGKRDFYENTKIGLRPFRNNISYFGIDADQLMQERPDLTQHLFGEVMGLFSEGLLHPLPYQCFEADQVVDAFRFMQHAKQIGKIVITYRDGINAVHDTLHAHESLRLAANATYLVTGGLNGFGLKTAQWLVSKGAKNLVLLSRSGAASAEAQIAIADFKLGGVNVWPTICDVTSEEALGNVFAHIAANMPPLRGIVHAAVVIEDGLIRNMNAEQIQRVFAPKILGARYLHEMTQHIEMDFFILFSSATTLFGNPGQASYVAANMYLESLVEARRAMGLTAFCVRWGAIEDVGFLARNADILDSLQNRMGGSAIKSDVALAFMEELLVSNRSGLGVLELDWRSLSRFLPSAQSPKFSELAAHGMDAEADDDHAEDMQRLLAELSPEELATTFVAMLKTEIGEILRMPIEKIDETRSIYDMGLDSLMGVELVLAIESRFGIRLPVMALSESPTITKLAEKVIAQVKSLNTAASVDISTAPSSDTEVASQMQKIAAQHAADIDAETFQKISNDIESKAADAGGAQQSNRMIH